MSNCVAVSIVVPVYNVEKYLEECLDSLCAQTLKEIEIICIDDGSTDGSLEILQAYQEKDPRITVVAKANTGYGDSMNRGFAQASGEYLGIVEPDDFTDPSMFEELYTLAKVHNADLVKSDYFEYQSQHEPYDFHVRNMPSELCRRVFAPIDDQRAFASNPAIWSAIYKRSFIEDNKIAFLSTPGASYQDASFNFKVFSCARRAYFIDKAHLHYRIDNEASSVKSQDKAFCICEEYAEIERFLAQDSERQAKLAKREQPVKFSGYMWNLDRLSSELQRNFYDRFVSEFQEAQKNGLLEQEYFSEHDWTRLSSMLEDPETYYVSTYGEQQKSPSFFGKLRHFFNH